ncbi:penicillin-binding transpeptidase domain-containing protein [Melissospora conviva]|uniref:peptidoglycan D,D-transpeptidase FtsI family protein n=1 Tax=Melissospora conviva TaxID=3388432 RepID=UPI003C263936
MAPRSDEPRRDPPGSRRGSGRGGNRTGQQPSGEPGRGISDARAYTPRGRSLREAAEQRRTPRTSRSGDPFRPALQVVEGGRAEGGSDTARRAGRRPAPVEGDRPPAQRTRDGGRVAEAVPRRRDTPPARQRRDGRTAPRRPSRKPRRPPRLADPARRLRLAGLLTLVVFATIGIRLVALQVGESPYAELTGRQRTVQLAAPRGAIYDRDAVVLAQSVEARAISADPTEITDPQATATALSPLLGIARTTLLERMAPGTTELGTPLRFRYVARGVSVDTARKIEQLRLEGIYSGRDERREVPGGDLAANLLGFTGRDMVGLEGLEARYDEVLRGRPGSWTYEAGNSGLDAPIPGGYSHRDEAEPGSNLYLTIDADLQFQVQKLLSESMPRVAGATASAVVLEVGTGEILAQASHPTYDAANWESSDPADRSDAATSFIVDPGSVHKAITFGAALEEGAVEPDTVLAVPNAIRKGDTTFADTYPANGRRMSLDGMLAHSSNVGTIMVADRLGPEKLHDYQRRFGLGEATGVGLPGEASGALLAPENWSDSSYGSVPIGHSVDATPLQMAAAYAAIANDGVYVRPRLIKKIVGADGTEQHVELDSRRVLGTENAAALRRMLEAVTTVPDATGGRAAVKGYRVAGKTGTGWRLVNGKKVAGDVASFIGMAPAENPRYVIAVFVHTPSGGGGDVSAPIFSDMMAFTLAHYRVPPSSAAPPKFEVFPR